jgi:hypothetical protein
LSGGHRQEHPPAYDFERERHRGALRKRFAINGEAVIMGVDGISDFNALHSGKHSCAPLTC